MTPVEGYEPSLGPTFAVWGATVAALYLPCVVWGRLKRERRYRWMALF